MEVIKKLNDVNINTSLLKIKKDLQEMQMLVNNFIDEEGLSLDDKVKRVKEINKRCTVYKAILKQTFNLINNYCTANYITVFKTIVDKWSVKYNQSISCSSSNTFYKSELSDDYKLTSYNKEAVEKIECLECFAACQVCNTAQTSCKGDYGKVTYDSCQACNTCQGCDAQYKSIIQYTCQKCDTCQSCNTGCLMGFST